MQAAYNILHTFREIHSIVIEFADSLSEDQLRWRPRGYSTSIGFHLWHLARESDYLRTVILERTPQLSSEFGEPVEIWVRNSLAQKWGFPTHLTATLGSGINDETAAAMPIPPKDELLNYLRAAYQAVEQFIELLDMRYPASRALEEGLETKIQNIRLTLVNFLTHDCRHLGMMECLKGLQTGFGSATEKP